ncbi:MAG: 50S ribosomal protein L10 [Alphaproteobacteria bacterium GWF2_58_20]|nr:MAG: 50S ribosomal protein L10 [Alphaproteobacteria bacterium GWF2_58_20]
MNRTQKAEVVSALQQMFADSGLVVVAHYSGMTVSEVTELRRKMLLAGAGVKVAKNRLTQIALKGTKFENLSDLFTGPTVIATSQDPVAAAKVAAEFAKGNEKLVILGGSLNGQTLDVKGVEALAKLPSLDELRAKLLGMLNTPATRIAGVVQAPAGQLARVVKAYAEKPAA